ncbi:sialin-like isoform X2 [Scylla paramamosain]|uniref:sialin-like isoform X2 n=1 Tax=Scylla paramamosain TaxID=85552 RepID=UPI003083648A
MHCHHHCSSSSFSSTSVIVAVAAASAANRNRDDEGEESCNWMCSFCGYLRYLLVFLGLLGCGMDYMLRYNISVAIVAMVNNSATFSVNSSYACPAASNASSDAQSSTGAGEYNWTPKEQGLVLGTFFWGYVITKAIGGRIAEILGPTFTVSLTLGLCSILSFLTPTIADVHPPRPRLPSPPDGVAAGANLPSHLQHYLPLDPSRRNNHHDLRLHVRCKSRRFGCPRVIWHRDQVLRVAVGLLGLWDCDAGLAAFLGPLRAGQPLQSSRNIKDGAASLV